MPAQCCPQWDLRDLLQCDFDREIYIGSLSTVPGTELLKSLEFPKWSEPWKCLMLGSRDDFWTPPRGGSRLNQPRNNRTIHVTTWSLEFAVLHTSNFWGREDWKMISSTHAYVMKSPLKKKERKVRELMCWWTHGDLREWRSIEALCLFPIPFPTRLFSGCSWVISFYNGLVIL